MTRPSTSRRALLLVNNNKNEFMIIKYMTINLLIRFLLLLTTASDRPFTDKPVPRFHTER